MLVRQVTAGTRAEVQSLEATGTLINEERHPCERGNRKFKIGDKLELHGLVEYPELNGQLVTVTNYRESDGDLNGYYIKSDTGEVEQWLNFVWEKRLKEID